MNSNRARQNRESARAEGIGTDNPDHLPNPANLEQVVQTELHDVAKRRQAAGFDAEHTRDVKDDLVGLALSGGGVRSASFNLGLLQALVASGALRYIDYLSTVSGGGYIGSFLDSLAYRRYAERSKEDKKSPPPVDALETMRPLENGGQPRDVMNLVANSHYLNDTVGFVNRYLIGLVLFNLTLFFGVLFLAAVMATLWRVMDTPPIVDVLLWVSNGYLLEWNRPFLPGLLLLVLWMLIWLGSFMRVGTAALANHSGLLLFFAGVFLLIGLAIWLGTPNMNFSNVFDSNFDPKNQKLSHWPSELTLPLGILLLVALLPFLRPWELIKSGVQKESFVRQWVFKVAGGALLVGIPFAAVWWAGRHNVSGTASRWDRPLNSADFLNWETLVGKMKAEVDKLDAEADPEKKKSLITPGTLFYARQMQTDTPPNEKDALAHLQNPVDAFWYQWSISKKGPSPFAWGPWLQPYSEYIDEENAKDDTAYWMNELLKSEDFAEALLRPGEPAEVRKPMWDPLESTCRHASLSIL